MPKKHIQGLSGRAWTNKTVVADQKQDDICLSLDIINIYVFDVWKRQWTMQNRLEDMCRASGIDSLLNCR